MLVDEAEHDRSSNPPETETPLDTPRLPSRTSPAPTAGSVGDVQAYWTGVPPQDASGYNTEYDEAGAEGEGEDAGGQAGDDSELGIDEELAQLS